VLIEIFNWNPSFVTLPVSCMATCIEQSLHLTRPSDYDWLIQARFRTASHSEPLDLDASGDAGLTANEAVRSSVPIIWWTEGGLT